MVMIACSMRARSAPSSATTKHSRMCFCRVVSAGLAPLRTASRAAGTGMVYCRASRTPGMRRTASEWPWLTPRPQKV